MTTLLIAAAALGAMAASLRWLRIAQREHYQPGSVTRFAIRWWGSSRFNILLATSAIVATVGVWWVEWLGWLAVAAVVGPLGLSIRGRSSTLSWTGRLRRLAIAAGVLVAVLMATGVINDRAGWAVTALVGLPVITDASLAVLGPIERRLGTKWVDQAKSRLAASGARVVAITGSYGKTTTKGYLGHLLAGRFRIVVSPASFNNRMGLARAINEHLAPGVDVFVAEMGTYGPGEIADLCSFVPPEIGVITAIGPVHLERFGRIEAIVAAKREILDQARVAVINVDEGLLAKVAEEEASHRKVVRVSARDNTADVSVVDQTLRVGTTEYGLVGPEVFGVNLACAVGVAIELGVSPHEVARRLDDLPVAAHRRQIATSERGIVIIDDTYNSNPDGAVAALGTLLAVPGNGRKVVVTPGMVELGERQDEENQQFALLAVNQATDLLVVGRTNRRALLRGAATGEATVTVVASRAEAVNWVRSHLGPGDAVLYENDLPDHYP
jgi:UDP-N-acetylmuramoyl-tripeptide--D-alanyl-D-alanine ligase